MVVVALALACAALTGCATQNAVKSSAKTPFYLGYDGEEIIRDQARVATIIGPDGLMIDRTTASPRKMRAATGTSFLRMTAIVDVLPGEHTVETMLDASGKPMLMTPRSFRFEAGRVYEVSPLYYDVEIREITREKNLRKIKDIRTNATFEQK